MSEKRQWKLLSNKSFRMVSGRIIKPNQVFEATEEEIPKAFRDLIVPMTPVPEEPALEVAPGGYSIMSRGPGWYDVVDAHGKVVNEGALRQADAQKLLGDLGK
ncbi:MAG: hypothetical protein D4R73_09160 [Deltaproteobacteria bacterium]|nr:MAG: hypothetical protein D4R73_09160 [Deltaproteobacteria bacterium]